MKSLIPPLTFLKILSCKGPNIFDIHTERRWEGLEICHVFTDATVFKQQIYCSFLRMGGWVVCGRRNCMIPNIKTDFAKKVTFLTLEPVLQ